MTDLGLCASPASIDLFRAVDSGCQQTLGKDKKDDGRTYLNHATANPLGRSRCGGQCERILCCSSSVALDVDVPIAFEEQLLLKEEL